MTSKISFSKFVKEDIRHRGWLAVLSFVLLLLSETIFAMLILDASLSHDEFSSMTLQLDEVRNVFPGLLNGNCSVALEAVLFSMAVLCAATGFAYLHSTERTDFYHSFPLSRTQWFCISYVGGLLIFLVPYLISSLLTVLAGIHYEIITSAVLCRSLLAVSGGILAFLLIYHVAIFAMVLTGKVVTGVLAALALSVYGNIAGGVGYEMASYFFDTYSRQGDGFYEKISGFLSPFVLSSQLIADTSGYDNLPSGSLIYISRLLRSSGTDDLIMCLICTVIFLAVLWSVSLLLYKRRPSEAAGNALAYPKTAPVIKVLVAIPTALYIGILIGSTYSGSTKWIIMISLLSAVLLCGLIEFIYHMDLRRLSAGKYSSLISILGVAGILCIFQFDLFGYDTWLPKESSLESMSFEINELYSYFCYPYSISVSSELLKDPDLLDGEEGTFYDFMPIYELAREGVENVNSGISLKNMYRLDASDEYVNLTVRYNKKSGSPSYRNYAVSKESALDTLERLCQEESYRRTLFPVFHIDVDEITAIRLMDIYQDSVLLQLSEGQKEALLDAYKKDVLKVDISELQKGVPIAELLVELPENNESGIYNYSITVPNLYLYESYENTLALLEEYGYTVRREINFEDVTLMKYIYPIEADTADAHAASSGFTPMERQERVVTDPEEIKEFLSQVRYSSARLLGQSLTPRSLEITMKENMDSYYYPLP